MIVDIIFLISKHSLINRSIFSLALSFISLSKESQYRVSEDDLSAIWKKFMNSFLDELFPPSTIFAPIDVPDLITWSISDQFSLFDLKPSDNLNTSKENLKQRFLNSCLNVFLLSNFKFIIQFWILNSEL